MPAETPAPKVLDVNAWLMVAQVALTAAAAVPGVDPKILGYIQTGLNATSAGIAAVNQAKAGVDPGALGPISEV